MPSTLTTETNGSGIRLEEEGVSNDAEAETFETDERSNRFNLSLGNLVHLALAYIGDGFRLQRPFDQNLLKTAMQQWLPTLDATPDPMA